MKRCFARCLIALLVVSVCASTLPLSAPALAFAPPSALEPAPSLAATSTAAAEPPARAIRPGADGVRYRSGDLLVRFTPQAGRSLALRSLLRSPSSITGLSALDELGAAHGLRAIDPVFRRLTRQKAAAVRASVFVSDAMSGWGQAEGLADVYKLSFPAEADVEQLAAAYRADPNVVYAEPNYVFEFDGTPDDPYLGQQWHLHNTGQYGGLADADIDAPEAWDVVTGTESIVIAVIDTGIDRDHPDLDDHMWSNPGETPGDGVDNDGNGYTDDTWGWNWVSDGSDPDDYEFNDPRDDNGHGTHVAGLAAAETNNAAGVAGVCWNCKLMSLKAFESNGVGTTSDIVQAIDYAASKGADVINMSFGSYAESLLLEDTLAAAYGQATLVAAAGNYGRTSKATQPYYPAAYPYVLGVGATDVGCVPTPQNCLQIAERRADFSNYGVNADVGAPGVSIYSTFRGGGYASMAGTSMAAPIVSGLAALLLSKNPTWSKEMARGQIVKTSDAIYTGEFGRVNAYSALTVVPTPDVQLPGDSILYGDADGDGDGIPDAGETFTVTLGLKNWWGEAQGTSAVLSSADPYVTILSDTAAYGDISAYATMRNLAAPFRVRLDPAAPNNHQVDFTLAISANGGAYTTSGAFSFLVQRGIEIPHALFPAVITQSMTLHSDYLYIVKQNMLVANGVTLTIEPGTRLQFEQDKFIKVQGTLIASGTEELPIIFTSNQKEPQPGDFQGIIFDDSATDAVLDPVPITTTIAAEGSAIPNVGLVLIITNAPRFDTIGDVYFSAVISQPLSSLPSELVLHWYNGVGFIEISSDLLPSGSTTTPFSETVSLVGAVGSQSVVFAQPSDEYVSGSILNRIVLEYGGGLLIDDSAPYVADSSFRQNLGAIPAGTSHYFGAITVDSTSGRALVIRGNTISDNPNHGVYIRGSSAGGRLMLTANTVRNNFLAVWADYIKEGWRSGAGLFLSGAMPVHAVGNVVEYSQAAACSGLYASGYGLDSLRLEANTFRRNKVIMAYDEFSNTDSGVCLDWASALVRRNIVAGNEGAKGYRPGDGSAKDGGSAFHVAGSAPVMQFNTIVGNKALPWQAPYTAPGLTVFFKLQPNSSVLTHNNILGNQASFDLYLSNTESAREDMDASQNYWGTADVNEIRYHHIYDYWQDFEPGEASFEPFLTTPEPLAPGFLWNATNTPPSPIGAETMTVTLDFSRDMNTAITPTVTFGVDEPYTQHRIESGQWVSPTRWVGAFDVTVDTGDGINTLKVSGAKDSDEMEIPEDTRFNFVIQTAGTSSILLEASADVSQVALNWVQNDVTDLAGYLLYRSAYTNTGYAQIGDGMFVDAVYTDTNVTNGVTYYYKYSVLDTDLNEVAWSNEVAVTPDDYTLPATPAVSDDGAATNYFERLHAAWSSSDPETGIAEYQVCLGTAAGACDTVSWTSLGLLADKTWTGLNLADGQSYYVNVRARNGADHWSATGSSDGITVDKLPAPSVTAAQPISGVRTLAHAITLTGSGFQASPAPDVRLEMGSHGGLPLQSVTVLNSACLTAQVPAGIAAGVYTATVTNFDTQVGVLPSAYTAANPAVGPRPLLFSPSPRQVGDDEASTTVDVLVQDISDLAAFQFDLSYDPVVVRVSDVTLGAFLGSGGRSTTALGPTIDNTSGRLSFGGVSYGAAPGASGSGTLATITFSPQAAGSASLALANVQLRDTLNSQIPDDPQAGQIQVVHYPAGDLDRDCDVDVADIMLVAACWNTVSGDPNYTAAYDFDGDGDIDVADIMQVAVAWGDTCGGQRVAQLLQAEEFAVRPASDEQRMVGGRQAGNTQETSLTRQALAPATVYAAPASRDAAVQSVYTLAVGVDNAEDMGAFQFDLAFDPALLRVDGVALGGSLDSTGRSIVDLGPVLDNAAGQVRYGAFSYGSSAGFSGTGQLAVITFTTFATPGASLLDLQNVQLVDAGAQNQPAQTADGRLVILSRTPLAVTRAITDGAGPYIFGDTCARLYFSDTGGLSLVTVTMVYSYPTAQAYTRPLPRSYSITGDKAGGFSALLALCYADAELGDTQEGSLQLYRYDTASRAWQAYSSVVDPAANLVTASISEFSVWVVGAPGYEPTRIMLSGLHARRGPAWPGGLAGALMLGAGLWWARRRRRGR
ncbi:MAG: S8 family serine peptidase [Thermoflexales bacterium]|nr:S8 family serine peptidase [Thermoflexales bacterium]